MEEPNLGSVTARAPEQVYHGDWKLQGGKNRFGGSRKVDERTEATSKFTIRQDGSKT